MDILATRQELKKHNIFEIPMRVTFYARVSTDSNEQLNSLENQVNFYRNYIKSNKNWTYVDGYIDEGLSGMSTKHRRNFNLMVEDAVTDKFDFIVTKEISRFARNTLDSIQFTRKLLSAGVGVFFQNDNINTLDEDSELRLTIMASLAQDEMRKLSSRVSFGHHQSIKKSVVLGNSRIFGYNKDGGHLVIDEDEAVMVRELFELYATNKYSMKQLEALLWERGFHNRNGKKIAHSTLSGIIANPKYKGYYVGNKVKVVDMFTKKQKFLPPEEWVMFKDESGDIVPAIVTEELWDEANRVLEKRSLDVKGRQNKCNHGNLLTGKLYCTECGKSYYRRDSKDRKGNVNSKWVCSGKINNGAESCMSFGIYESEIIPVLYDVFKEAMPELEEKIDEYTAMFRQLNTADNVSAEIDKLREKITLAEKKKSKLLEYNVLGQITDRDFVRMNTDCDKEIRESEMAISELEEQLSTQSGFREQLNAMRKLMSDLSNDASYGVIDKSFVDKYIDKIFASPVDEDTIRLEIKLFTGDTAERILQNLRNRSGVTIKKMIEAYENGLK